MPVAPRPARSHRHVPLARVCRIGHHVVAADHAAPTMAAAGTDPELPLVGSRCGGTNRGGAHMAARARALRVLACALLEPGRTRDVYAAVLRHALLAPILALWLEPGGGHDVSRDAARVAALDVVSLLLRANARDSDAVLRLLIATGLVEIIRAGIPDARTELRLADATGRFASAYTDAASHCRSDMPLLRHNTQMTAGLYRCMTPWSTRRVEEELARDMAEQSDLTLCGPGVWQGRGAPHGPPYLENCTACTRIPVHRIGYID